MVSSSKHPARLVEPARVGQIDTPRPIPDRPAPPMVSEGVLGHAFVVPRVREVRAPRAPKDAPELW